METKQRKGQNWNSSKDKSAWGGSNEDSQTVNNDFDNGNNPLKKRDSMPDTRDRNNGRPEVFEVFFMGASTDVTEDELRSHFESCGEIGFVKLLMRDGEATGRGFVKFPEESSQRKALKLNGSDLGGRTLKVELPKPKGDRVGGTGGGGGQRDSRPHEPGEENSSIMLRNLSYNLTEDELTDFFKSCGEIRSVRVCKDDEGKSRGFGFVDFNSIGDAKKAVAKHGSEVGGRSITVVFSRKRERVEREDRDDHHKNKSSGDDSGGDAW
jgi:RNA recognition motif-containing protein